MFGVGDQRQIIDLRMQHMNTSASISERVFAREQILISKYLDTFNTFLLER